MASSKNDDRITVEYMPLSKLLRAPRNPKEHDLGAVHESIDRFGFVNPIIMNEKTGRLVAGHGRLDTLQQQKATGRKPPSRIFEKDGEWMVPVVRGVTFADDMEAEAYVVADNRTGELGGWNEEALVAILSDHAATAASLTGIGFDKNDLDEMLKRINQGTQLPDQDDVPLNKADELAKKWGTALGQIWDIAGNRIWCGDSRTPPTELFADNKIRLIWTDPPYGVSYADKNKYLNKTDRGNHIQTEIANDHMSPEETETLFAGALAACVPFCAGGAAIYATVPSGPLYPRFATGLERGGFTYKHGLVWIKNHFVLGHSDYHYRHEPIIYGWLDNGAHVWVGDRSQDSVFEVDRPSVSDMHPTTKPIELVARMIANSSFPTDIVYDPFSGSGTTIVAAHQLGRIGYGCELSPGYVAVTLERLAALGLQPKICN